MAEGKNSPRAKKERSGSFGEAVTVEDITIMKLMEEIMEFD